MSWIKLLAYISGSVDQELLLRVHGEFPLKCVSLDICPMPPKSAPQPAPEGMLGATNPEREKLSRINKMIFLTIFISPSHRHHANHRPGVRLSSEIPVWLFSLVVGLLTFLLSLTAPMPFDECVSFWVPPGNKWIWKKL